MSVPRQIPVPKDDLVRMMRAAAEKIGPECAVRLPGWHEVLLAIGLDEAQLMFARRTEVVVPMRGNG